MDQKSENVEEVDQTLKMLEKENKCVSIKNMMKVYPSGKKAVNNLSLSMYNNQIFVLLGRALVNFLFITINIYSLKIKKYPRT